MQQKLLKSKHGKKEEWRKTFKLKKKKDYGTTSCSVIGASKEERMMNRNVFWELITKMFLNLMKLINPQI